MAVQIATATIFARGVIISFRFNEKAPSENHEKSKRLSFKDSRDGEAERLCRKNGIL
ncbi:hypothetical protein [Phytobacter sp. AG2a]|jgi:hypothetical protein